MSSTTKKRMQRHTETSDYAAFLLRAITRLSDRIADDPAMLAHVEQISQALTDAVNRGIFAAKNKGWQPYSLAEMGRIYGCSYQNIQQRAKRGEAAMVAYEARRSGGAIVRIGDIRAARATAERGRRGGRYRFDARTFGSTGDRHRQHSGA